MTNPRVTKLTVNVPLVTSRCLFKRSTVTLGLRKGKGPSGLEIYGPKMKEFAVF
jgi:hypothetical protein